MSDNESDRSDESDASSRSHDSHPWALQSRASGEQLSTLCSIWHGARCARCGARVGLSLRAQYESAVYDAAKTGDASRMSTLLLDPLADDEGSSLLFNSALSRTAWRRHIVVADLLLDATPRRVTSVDLDDALRLCKQGVDYLDRGGTLDLERVERIFRDERLQIREPYRAITSCIESPPGDYYDDGKKDKTAADGRWLELLLDHIDPNTVEPELRELTENDLCGEEGYEFFEHRDREKLHAGSTPLFYALEFGIKQEPNGANMNIWDPDSPRSWLFNRLVDHPRIDVDRTARKDHMTPLHLATLQGNIHCVRALLRRGARPDLRLTVTESRTQNDLYFYPDEEASNRTEHPTHNDSLRYADEEALNLCVYSVHRAWGTGPKRRDYPDGYRITGDGFYPNELVPAARFHEVRDTAIFDENAAFCTSTTEFFKSEDYGRRWEILDAEAFSLDDMISLYTISTGRSTTARAIRSARMWQVAGSLIALRELFKRDHAQSADRAALRTVCLTDGIFASILKFACIPAPRAINSSRLQRYLKGNYDRVVGWTQQQRQRPPFDYVTQSRLRLARLAAKTITATTRPSRYPEDRPDW